MSASLQKLKRTESIRYGNRDCGKNINVRRVKGDIFLKFEYRITIYVTKR